MMGNGLLRNFWCGCRDGKRKTCCVSWEDMTTPKYAGGMGFRDIELFNLSLLARQAWRILQNPETLSAKILKAVYYPDNDFLESQVGFRTHRRYGVLSLMEKRSCRVSFIVLG
jgi:hypothetical protein